MCKVHLAFNLTTVVAGGVEAEALTACQSEHNTADCPRKTRPPCALLEVNTAQLMYLNSDSPLWPHPSAPVSFAPVRT